ncbi:Uncharacterised protein [Mycobacterium tuberculosis]|nr:Uncharacterised protein [Mycobacterium tuberculosis]
MTSTIQCIWMPRMSCQTSTDSPKDAPRESNTVPTITRAAMKLRVMISMIMKIRQIAAIPAIIRSYLELFTRSFTIAAVPVR